MRPLLTSSTRWGAYDRGLAAGSGDREAHGRKGQTSDHLKTKT
jgi:hypothetical protein